MISLLTFVYKTGKLIPEVSLFGMKSSFSIGSFLLMNLVSNLFLQLLIF